SLELMKILFEYDYMGRRVSKTVYKNGEIDYERRFVYDGWNLVAELDGSDELVKSYVWGKDLSGSMQGAGGVGGLLSMTVASTGQTYFYCYDGNGNVTGLVEASTGDMVVEYEYSPFGEVISDGGDIVNPFRWSTKYEDFETGLNYYGFRYYSSELGRWLNRDPIAEAGGLNLYGFVGNDGVNSWDLLGLVIILDEHSFLTVFETAAEHYFNDEMEFELSGGLLKYIKDETREMDIKKYKAIFERMCEKRWSGNIDINKDDTVTKPYSYGSAFFTDGGMFESIKWLIANVSMDVERKITGCLVCSEGKPLGLVEFDMKYEFTDKFDFHNDNPGRKWVYRFFAEIAGDWIYHGLLDAGAPTIHAKWEDNFEVLY
ncbi:MAG: RHS repeat-associated core domain-containing protein, partial [Planctomycetes bacterium]|nr:RHS repeat-associated core domain-containing protein [Planctomycetota bacterium]